MSDNKICVNVSTKLTVHYHRPVIAISKKQKVIVVLRANYFIMTAFFTHTYQQTALH